MKRNTKLNYLIKIALFGAIAGVIMMIEAPLAIFPSFLKIDLGDIPAVIGSLVLGPIAGILIQGIKVIMHTLLKGTTSFGIGELASFLIGIAYVIPVGLIYKKFNKSFKSAIFGMIVGCVSLVMVGALANHFLLLPFYARVYGLSIDGILDMSRQVPIFGKLMISEWTFILYGITPFNIFKGIVITIVTSLIYKFVVPPLSASNDN